MLYFPVNNQLKAIKCKNCGVRNKLMDSRPRQMEPIISVILPYKPMRCRHCLRRAMYIDKIFTNKWRVALWVVLLLFLLIPILESITIENPNDFSGYLQTSKPDWMLV